MKASALLLIVVNLLLVKGQDYSDSSDSDIRSAARSETCSEQVQCLSHKNLECLNGKCECKAEFKYDHHSEGCLVPPTAENGFKCTKDTQCQLGSSFGSYSRCSSKNICECYHSYEPVVQIQDTCFEVKEIGHSCTTHAECNATIKGEAICTALENDNHRVCQCASGFEFDVRQQEQECFKIGSFGSACSTDFQCNGLRALGPLSRCSPKNQMCECWDTSGNEKSETRHLNGKCYFVRGVNETCSFKEECELGFHPNSDCLPHPSYNDERVCQCPPNQKCAGCTAYASFGISIFVCTFVLLKLVSVV